MRSGARRTHALTDMWAAHLFSFRNFHLKVYPCTTIITTHGLLNTALIFTRRLVHGPK